MSDSQHFCCNAIVSALNVMVEDDCTCVVRGVLWGMPRQVIMSCQTYHIMSCHGDLSHDRGVCMHRGMKRQSCSCQWRPCVTEEAWLSPQISCALSNSCSRWCTIRVAQPAWHFLWVSMAMSQYGFVKWNIFCMSTLFAMNCSMPLMFSLALTPRTPVWAHMSHDCTLYWMYLMH